MFCQLKLISKKKNLVQKCAKNAKKKKNNQTLKSFPRSILTKYIFLEQLTAMPQYHVQNMFFFLFCLSRHHDTNPLLHLYHFRKTNIITYWVLTLNHQGSYFPFFLSSSSGSNIFVPQQILLPFQAQC